MTRRPAISRRTTRRTPTGRGRARAALPAVALLALAGACAPPSVEQTVVEDRIAEHVIEELGAVPDDTTCPDQIRGEVDETMICLVGFEGEEFDVEVQVTEVTGDDPEDVELRFEVLDREEVG